MNTLDDLRVEWDRLAAEAPDEAILGAEIRRLSTRQVRRRRVGALVTVVACVAVIAGGITVTSALLRDHGGQTANPAAGPQVPIPAGSALIRHETSPVTSPVIAVPPDGLTARSWQAGPGVLSVSWYDPRATDHPGYAWDGDRAAGAVVPQVAGFVITDDREPVFSDGRVITTPQQEKISIAGHAAMLETAPFPAFDALGLPADVRIVWQLTDGRWLQVWFQDVAELETPVDRLRAFAETIVERPEVLPRHLEMGLTVPGLDADWPADSGSAGESSLRLCPEGVDPLVVKGARMSENTAGRCFSAVAQAGAPAPSGGDVITVNGVAITVQQGRASYVRDDGVVVSVTGPNDVALSVDELAAVAASVRLVESG